ncbi:MAG: type II secretion system F family protein [Candidatus Micrarchaeia archaeon]
MAVDWYVNLWAELLRYNDIGYDARKFSINLFFGSLDFGMIALILLRLGAFQVLGGALAVSALVHVAVYTYLLLGANSRGGKVEEVLPDFLSLVASNIRSGLTPDKAIIMSARPEFGPLASAVANAGKNSITGMPLDQVMMSMNERIKSEVLSKTIWLVVEGLHSGGDMSELLEKTAFDLRKFRSVKREVNSIVLNYVLFIMTAVTFGAPLLYGISGFLIEIMMAIKSRTGSGGDAFAAMSQVNIFKGKMAFTSEGLTLFSAVAIGVTVLFGCMAVGVMSTGRREDGLKYFPFLLVIAIGLMLGMKMALMALLGPMISG